MKRTGGSHPYGDNIPLSNNNVGDEDDRHLLRRMEPSSSHEAFNNQAEAHVLNSPQQLQQFPNAMSTYQGMDSSSREVSKKQKFDVSALNSVEKEMVYEGINGNIRGSSSAEGNSDHILLGSSAHEIMKPMLNEVLPSQIQIRDETPLSYSPHPTSPVPSDVLKKNNNESAGNDECMRNEGDGKTSSGSGTFDGLSDLEDVSSSSRRRRYDFDYYNWLDMSSFDPSPFDFLCTLDDCNHFPTVVNKPSN
ncbi:uncharacterized protein G2W53_044166 [Senna tora]|uniref:Uncharacterized protein n=1 Tax=Senna tora TaxID=362788 RepID=A0A834W121_9FABA|nr:uncharacterized protein G2W53_044166 [Senna tora]